MNMGMGLTRPTMNMGMGPTMNMGMGPTRPTMNMGMGPTRPNKDGGLGNNSLTPSQTLKSTVQPAAASGVVL